MFSFQSFPAHVQLMLLTARIRTTASEVESIQQLVSSPTLDWPQFLDVTAHHRLSSLVFESLDRLRPTNLPTHVRNELHRRATANAFEALRSTSQVKRITARFADAGFNLSVLKGVPLSQFLFGSPNARHVGDIDLLTTRDRLPEQIALLAELGFDRVNPASRLTPNRIASYVSFWKDFTFANRKTGFELDLHWRLFNNRFHAANRILTHATYTTVTAFNLPMRVFSFQDQFIYIAAHGVLDAWTYFKSLADVAAFLRIMSPAELDHTLTRARDLGLLAQISGAIHLSNDWMGTTTQSPLLLPASEPSARKVRDRTTAMLLRQNFQPDRSFPSPAQWLMLEIEVVPGLSSLTEIARRFVWRPRVWSSVDLPDHLFWLYPLLGLIIPPQRHHATED